MHFNLPGTNDFDFLIGYLKNLKIHYFNLVLL